MTKAEFIKTRVFHLDTEKFASMVWDAATETAEEKFNSAQPLKSEILLCARREAKPCQKDIYCNCVPAFCSWQRKTSDI
jgi:hypothetical protein